MGAAISSTVTMGLTYCCFSAAGSLCQACLGSTATGTTGRKRSALLLSVAIALSLWFQYSLGPRMVNGHDSSSSSGSWMWHLLRWIPGLGSRLHHAWYDDCATYEDDTTMLQQCAGVAGVYRVMAVTATFFLLQAIATGIQPDLNREAWPAKMTLYLFAVTLTIFMDSAPTYTRIFLWLARLGATLFVVLQQVILVDVAYNWNEHWVDQADQADRVDYGSGASWLQAIVATCVAFYILAVTGISLLYQYFDGCAENVWIITLTLLAIVAMTGIQLSGSEGSLLTSAVMSLYAVYLAYSMVSKNPNPVCNPQLGHNDVWGIIAGLTLTAVSLAWTGWSWTAESRLQVDAMQTAHAVPASSTSSSDGGGVNLEVPFLDPNSQPTQGLVLDTEFRGNDNNRSSLAGSDLYKLNLVMALISCWVAMTLTGWGGSIIGYDPESDTTTGAANPTVGRVNMAMLGISQWLAVLLYVWTLLAPRLFPDRDFS